MNREKIESLIEKRLLDYTGSSEWKQIGGLKWTSAEIIDCMIPLLEKMEVKNVK